MPAGAGQAEQRLEFGAGTAEGVECGAEQVGGQVPGGRDDGVRAGQVQQVVVVALEVDVAQFEQGVRGAVADGQAESQ